MFFKYTACAYGVLVFPTAFQPGDARARHVLAVGLRIVWDFILQVLLSHYLLLVCGALG